MPHLTRIAAAVLLVMISSTSKAADVIANLAVDERNLSVAVIRLVFTMRMLRWPDGTRIRVFVLPDAHSVHREFAKKSLELYPRQLRRVWDRYRFSGSGPVPVEVASEAEMAERVATTPGAIGYLPDGAATDEVRVIHVR